MNKTDISIIVVGALNTDIIATGANKLLKAGEHTYAQELSISAGGKSRNIAQMIATLIGEGCVAMVGKTSDDPYGLWKTPIAALKKAGVSTDYIKIASFKKTGKLPGVALIPVDKSGNNQIYVVPGITETFEPSDIDDSVELFKRVGNNNGILVLTLEIPLETAIYTIKKANDNGIKVFLDSGGLIEGRDYKKLFEKKISFLKPNEHETKILTGIEITDFDSAKSAALKLLKLNVDNVLITHGASGGYLFNKDLAEHIPIPSLVKSPINDETGCGDAAMSALCVSVLEGKDIKKAAEIAILAGTLEFGKSGVTPLTKSELNLGK